MRWPTIALTATLAGAFACGPTVPDRPAPGNEPPPSPVPPTPEPAAAPGAACQRDNDCVVSHATCCECCPCGVRAITAAEHAQDKRFCASASCRCPDTPCPACDDTTGIDVRAACQRGQCVVVPNHP